MRMIQLLMFVLVMNAAIPLANSFAIVPQQATYLRAGVNTNNPFGQQAILQSIQVTQGANGTYTQSANLGTSSLMSSTVLVFGDFYWGLVHFIPLMAESMVLPGMFLTEFGAPPLLASIFTLLSWLVYAVFIFTTITGRYVED